MKMMKSSEIEGVLSVLSMMKASASGSGSGSSGGSGSRCDVNSNGTLKIERLMGLMMSVRLARSGVMRRRQTREVLRKQLELSHGYWTVR